MSINGIDVYKKSKDAVVIVQSVYNFNSEFNNISSGFFVSKDGYIVTCAHSVKNYDVFLGNGFLSPDQILVTAFNVNGKGKSKVFNANLIGVDGALDVAVIKINVTNQTFLDFGVSRDVEPGSIVYTIGFTLLRDVSSFTAGTMRDNNWSTDLYPFETLFVSNSSFPGNSGGPVLNSKGQIIGMVSFTLDQNEFFNDVADNAAGCVSQFMMERVVKEMIETNADYVKSFIGITTSKLTLFGYTTLIPSNEILGFLVINVITGSPADGVLQVGDVITGVNDVEIGTLSTQNKIPSIIWFTEPNEDIKITVIRNSIYIDLIVEVETYDVFFDQPLEGVINGYVDKKGEYIPDIKRFLKKTSKKYGLLKSQKKIMNNKFKTKS